MPARGKNCCSLVDRHLLSGIISACGWAGPTEGGSGYSTGFGSRVFSVKNSHTKAAFLKSVCNYEGFLVSTAEFEHSLCAQIPV